MNKKNIVEYNHKILSEERKKQKKSLESISNELTLSVDQIKSLENNLMHGFITPHFKNIALKRYINFLGLDFNKIISTDIEFKKELEEVEEIDTEDKIKPPFLSKLNFLSKLKIKKIPNHLMLIISCLIILLIIIQNSDFDQENPNLKTNTPKINNIKEKIIANNTQSPINKDFLENKKTIPKENTQEIKNEPDTTPIEFLCSIKSAPINKIWSRQNPDKPADYFHIISLEKQSICTIDNQGRFKQYDLNKGTKLTHRGEAPFKIQLNPSISELYFQGWKVILKENDTFIQLNPIEMNIN
tara:strand:+ start:531 stop:1430 length:900 start_codon:yes stop_codon:yes gene_type:complete